MSSILRAFTSLFISNNDNNNNEKQPPLNNTPWAKRPQSTESDSLLVQEIKQKSQFTDLFWNELKNNTHNICVTGSFPLAVAHNLTDDTNWSDGDIDVFVTSTYIQQHGMLKLWSLLGIEKSQTQDEKKNETTTSNTACAAAAVGSVQPKPYPKKSILVSEKRRHTMTGKTVNLIMANIKGYTTLQDYITKTFDYVSLAMSTDGTTLFVPKDERDHIRSLQSRVNVSRIIPIRLAKYTKRGIQIVATEKSPVVVETKQQ